MGGFTQVRQDGHEPRAAGDVGLLRHKRREAGAAGVLRR